MPGRLSQPALPSPHIAGPGLRQPFSEVSRAATTQEALDIGPPMLALHRCRLLPWSPSPVVALCSSFDKTRIAAARECGDIEIWRAAAGSVGWHLELRIPGGKDVLITSLVWVEDQPASPWGRLFSAGLDGHITEWDLASLQPKAVVDSYGGPVWALAAEEILQKSKPATDRREATQPSTQDRVEGSDVDGGSESDVEEEEPQREQRVAVACDDGCVRLFTAEHDTNGLVYKRSFLRVQGRILSVAWGPQGNQLFSGGSDGCIRCWDAISGRELLRMTAGLGDLGSESDLCIWALLPLRDGTLVSGDGSGATQFWDTRVGTLLQSQRRHKGDVLALAAAPAEDAVFAAGVDGQILMYQRVSEDSHPGSSSQATSASASAKQPSGNQQWVYIGHRRSTHDVRALAVVFPEPPNDPLSDKELTSRQRRSRRRRRYKTKSATTPMLVSGGNDTLLLTYPATGFLAFHPYCIDSAPQAPLIQLAKWAGSDMLALSQHCTWLDVWKLDTSVTVAEAPRQPSTEESLKNHELRYKKRVRREKDSPWVGPGTPWLGKKGLQQKGGDVLGFGPLGAQGAASSHGKPPSLLAKIKVAGARLVACSAISPDGTHIAYSDLLKTRLFRLGKPEGDHKWSIVRRSLPESVPAAHQMVFSSGSNSLILAGREGRLWVVDLEEGSVAAELSPPVRDTAAPVKALAVSPGSKWLAVADALGRVDVYNLKKAKHYWSVPVLDGSTPVALAFHPNLAGTALAIATSSNRLHILDVKKKDLSDWSKANSAKLPRSLLEMPGGITGLSVPVEDEGTSQTLIAYGPKSFCYIDLSRPVSRSLTPASGEGPKEEQKPKKKKKKKHKEGEGADGSTTDMSSKDDKANDHEVKEPSDSKTRMPNGVLAKAEGNGRVGRGKTEAERYTNCRVVPFRNPTFFLGFLGSNNAFLVEKSWAEVLAKLPAPLFRHMYGT